MRLDKITAAQIPYYGLMKNALPAAGNGQEKRKFKNGRLTEVDPKTHKPRLKQGVTPARAVEVLYMFENMDVTPYQIAEMKETIENQRLRIMKLEDWQE